MYLDEVARSILMKVKAVQATTPLDEIINAAKDKAKVESKSSSFIDSIKKPGVSLVAEAKKASPSAGILKANYDVAELVRVYEENGASAISVLTQPAGFMGDKSHLEIAAQNCNLPILQKDFFVDKYQLYEAKLLGASAVLLIATLLDDAQIDGFIKISRDLNMDAIIEVHTEYELKRILELEPMIIGINSRNLKDFSVDLNTSIGLGVIAKEKGVVVIAESGIKTREDVVKLETAGFDAMLVGSSIVSSNNPGKIIRELLGRE